MGRFYIVIGKSASGKDRIYKELQKDSLLSLKPMILYTTRPMREGESSGKEYYFTDETKMRELDHSGRIIESRVYDTVFGKWYYFTADEGQFDDRSDFLGIGTLESYVRIRDYFGRDRVVPLYIECENKTRLLRAIERESTQKTPEYKEVCRRYLADEEDFSEEKLAQAGITERFDNSSELENCVEAIRNYIRTHTAKN